MSRSLPERLAEASAHADELLRPSGRMISASKSTYRRRYPTHFIVFNARLCLGEGPAFWSGDIDLDTTADVDALTMLGRRVAERIFLLHERDAVLENTDHPLVDYALAIIHAAGQIERRPRPIHVWGSSGRRLI